MILIGLAVHFGESVLTQNFFTIGIAAGITAATFFFSWLLWKLGVWAGGDVKLFTALAALNPFNLGVLRDLLGLKFSLLASLSIPIFPLTLFIFSIFAMVPYGSLLSVHGLKKKPELRKELFKDFKAKLVNSVEYSMLLVGIYALLGNFSLDFWLQLVATLAVIFAYRLVKFRLKLAVPIALFFYSLYLNAIFSVSYAVYLFLFFFAVYAVLKLYSVSKSEVLREEIPVERLEEGMIPAESLYEVEGKVVKAEKLSIGKIINNFRTNSLDSLQKLLSPPGKAIVDARKARGLLKEEIDELRKLQSEGKIREKIWVKKTAPMIPAVLIAYIILNLVGDALWNLLF